MRDFIASINEMGSVDDEVRDIVATLPELASVEGVCAAVDARMARGDFAFGVDLCLAIAQAHGPDARGSVFDHVFGRLARTSGTETAVQALRLVCSKEFRSVALDRWAARWLASGHPAEDMVSAFTDDAVSDELRACLVQELLLKGDAVAETRVVAEWVSRRWDTHALGWLPPLRLSDVEARRDLGFGRISLPPLGSMLEGGTEIASRAPGPSVEEVTTPAVHRAIVAAVSGWVDRAGRAEARVFRFADPVKVEAVPSLLPALDLVSLADVGPAAPLVVKAWPPALAWWALYAAAMPGGAYDGGLGGAYGRLAVWRSLAGLCGVADDAPFDEVDAAVRKAGWYGFHADTNWFEWIAWDLGVAALSPDRRRLAILAATDTD
ncbi:DUF6183 family protein [Saccharothrix sp. NPDC042600]|uniref:DUF6183 family protein n=1 Tax=Saccharothrix TaxID=2071 RepID=UPI0033C2D36B|nr:hypothetical protein GCM10017745_47820 [Saccharothrix mutabilis subsp. capreolus]